MVCWDSFDETSDMFLELFNSAQCQCIRVKKQYAVITSDCDWLHCLSLLLITSQVSTALLWWSVHWNVPFNFPATEIMIKNLTIRASEKTFIVKWPAPSLLPHYYTLKTLCKLMCNQEAYPLPRDTIPGNETSHTLGHVFSWSACSSNLLAVYNPAAIDTGISHTFDTPTAGEIIYNIPPIYLGNNLHIHHVAIYQSTYICLLSICTCTYLSVSHFMQLYIRAWIEERNMQLIWDTNFIYVYYSKLCSKNNDWCLHVCLETTTHKTQKGRSK